ncbi:hypothetical protein [Heliorestis convoluta]|uniref:Uncharacterized protein n=1 Tax=Heliorestis convoluta TaxID=356322 RepID=A0A5Q2MYC4_9FIRM|nr:hypothetical protein [Heliorestis convoluta]QGG46941.1 hypothetical protein FTV88_0765 [Heliorestis convoluta]
MEGWALKRGERPYKIVVATRKEKGEGLQNLHFYAKIKENGFVDCFLIFDYGHKKSTRQAKDFPVDQFEYFLQGVQQRCPLPCRLIDGEEEEGMAYTMWENFFGVDNNILAG